MSDIDKLKNGLRTLGHTQHADLIEELQQRLRIAEAERATQKAFLDVVWSEFNIGEKARTPSVLRVNLQNTKRFADYLHSVEREFFMVPGEPDEDYPDDAPGDVCLVSCWGSSKDKYLQDFRNAMIIWKADANQPDQ
jgi:hypothetical protein